MNITNKDIKDIYKCENLNNNQIKKISEKLKIKSTTKGKTCALIKKEISKKNPCILSLYNNTNLNLKKHQIGVGNFLMNNDAVIVVHSIGTGKTLTSISSAQCLLLNNKIEHVIVITPTSLQDNFKNQARIYGIDNNFLNDNYSFYTINSLTNAIKNNTAISSVNSLVIIDEAHNLRKLDGKQYKSIFKFTKKASKIMLLTATPLINYPYDIINLISIVKKEKAITDDKFDKMMKDKIEFKNYVKNIFDFYRKDVEKSTDFPNKRIYEIFLPMSSSYYKTYQEIEDGEVSKIPAFQDKNIQVFYNGLRRISNVIENKSKKVDWIVNKIESNLKSKFLIFSHFLNMGIVPIMNWLKKNKIKFANITGDLSIKQRNEALEKYNNDEIRILFITKAGSEGLNLKNTNFIIIMEPSWNLNSIEQIIGRGVRYRSHSISNKLVKIYKLYSLKPDELLNIKDITDKNLLENNGNMLSVDLYLRNYSYIKQQKIDKFISLLYKYRIKYIN